MHYKINPRKNKLLSLTVKSYIDWFVITLYIIINIPSCFSFDGFMINFNGYRLPKRNVILSLLLSEWCNKLNRLSVCSVGRHVMNFNGNQSIVKLFHLWGQVTPRDKWNDLNWGKKTRNRWHAFWIFSDYFKNL